MMDSMTVSQLKGLLTFEYATEISDEFLFRETSNVEGLCEVVKRGYALDDTRGEGLREGEGPGGAGVCGSEVGHVGGDKKQPMFGGPQPGMGGPPGVCCSIS